MRYVPRERGRTHRELKDENRGTFLQYLHAEKLIKQAHYRVGRLSLSLPPDIPGGRRTGKIGGRSAKTL